MLSIEEIKLLIEKLEKVKKEDLQKLIDSNLKILKDLELAVDANNQEEINRLDKTVDWFKLDLDKKNDKPQDQVLFNAVQSTIFKFAKSNMYNSLENISIPIGAIDLIWSRFLTNPITSFSPSSGSNLAEIVSSTISSQGSFETPFNCMLIILSPDILSRSSGSPPDLW